MDLNPGQDLFDKNSALPARSASLAPSRAPGSRWLDVEALASHPPPIGPSREAKAKAQGTRRDPRQGTRATTHLHEDQPVLGALGGAHRVEPLVHGARPVPRALSPRRRPARPSAGGGEPRGFRATVEVRQGRAGVPRGRSRSPPPSPPEPGDRRPRLPRPRPRVLGTTGVWPGFRAGWVEPALAGGTFRARCRGGRRVGSVERGVQAGRQSSG